MSITLNTDSLYCDTPTPPDLNTLRGGLFDEAVRKFEKERREALKNWQEFFWASMIRQQERDLSLVTGRPQCTQAYSYGLTDGEVDGE